jgi:hypothetical protein
MPGNRPKRPPKPPENTPKIAVKKVSKIGRKIPLLNKLKKASPGLKSQTPPRLTSLAPSAAENKVFERFYASKKTGLFLCGIKLCV